MVDERREHEEERFEAMLQMKDDIGQLKAMVGTLVKAQELEDKDHKNIGDRLAKIESRMSTVPDDVHHEHHDFWTVYIEEISELAKNVTRRFGVRLSLKVYGQLCCWFLAGLVGSTEGADMQIRTLDEIDTIVVHCSYTKPSMKVDANWIRQIHIGENGWDDIGYEAVIVRGDNPKALIQGGRPFEYVPAHTFGHNRTSIGICLVGGMSEAGYPDCNFTAAQFEALADLLHAWIIRFRIKRVVGHRDLDASKDCPCFDAQQFAAAEIAAFGGR